MRGGFLWGAHEDAFGRAAIVSSASMGAEITDTVDNGEKLANEIEARTLAFF
jgi:hypothetical protein